MAIAPAGAGAAVVDAAGAGAAGVAGAAEGGAAAGGAAAGTGGAAAGADGALGSVFWPQAASRASDATGMIWIKRRRDAVERVFINDAPRWFANKIWVPCNGQYACLVPRVVLPRASINKA